MCAPNLNNVHSKIIKRPARNVKYPIFNVSGMRVYLPKGSIKQYSTYLEKRFIDIQIHQQMVLNERNNEWMCETTVAVFAEGLRSAMISIWVNSGRSRATSSRFSPLILDHL